MKAAVEVNRKYILVPPDADGRAPIHGHSETDCDACTGDRIDHTVTWNGRSNVGNLEGQPVRLKFCLERARLFSFQFGRSNAA